MPREGAGGEWGRRISRGLSYKKITIAVCSLNLLALKSLRLFLGSPPDRPAPLSVVKHTEEQIRRIEAAVRVRLASELVKPVNLKLRKELRGEMRRRWELSDSMMQEMANEILRRSRGLNETEKQGDTDLNQDGSCPIL